MQQVRKKYIPSGIALPLGYSLLLLSCFILPCNRTYTQSNSIPPIGQWRDHLNYQQAIQVMKGDKLYCATTYGIFSLDDHYEAERYSKTSGLNDIGIQSLGWDSLTRQLVVAYTNSNLDLIGKSSIKNISDIKRSSIAGNKTIYSVFCKEGIAYLCSGLGIIVANLSRYEIKDTWFIGNQGGQVKVNGFTADATRFFAATEEGLKYIPQNAANPSDYTSWVTPSGTNGLSAGAVKNVVYSNNRVVLEKNDSLFILDNTDWRLLYTDKNWPIIRTVASENKLLVCQRTATGAARVLQLDTNGQIEKIIAQNNVISFPRAAIIENNTVWVADQFGGLSQSGPGGTVQFIPNGPPGTADGEMLFSKDHLYAAAGSVNNAWNYQYNRNGVYDFMEDKWSDKGAFNLPQLDSVLDFITVAIDQPDAGIWAGSYGGGLVYFATGANTTIYKKNNSPLQAATGDPNSYRVSGLAFDKGHNLWISNYGAPQNLHVRKTDGTWKSFAIPFSLLENAVAQILADDNNQLWIVSPKNIRLICYQYGTSIDNTADDKWKLYRQGTGYGNLPSNNVLSLLKDKNGFIWVGTDKGIGIIQCSSDVFSGQGCDAALPVVQLDRFAGLLFRDEMVQCMAVDGANRKWIGTKNGVWLISPDGDKIIYRFTEENSPLFSNDVKRIAVNPVTGEVFISTSNGICSFRSTATEGNSSNSSVLVFPNPIPPGYNGTIAIRGVTDNALVKIAELNGRLVYQTRALGGQAIWNGRNYKGEKTASGIYLVLIRDDNGNEKTVTKIVITSGR